MINTDASLVVKQCASEEELQVGWKFLDGQLNLSLQHGKDYEFYQKQFAEYPEYIIIAKIQYQIGGCVFAYKMANEDLHIAGVAVNPAYHHRGIGSLMLNLVEENARSNKIKRLTLGARDKLAPFYEKNGFTANMLVQSRPPVEMEDLLAINPDREIIDKYTRNEWNNLLLRTNGVHKALEDLYTKYIPEVIISYVYEKVLSS